MFENRTPINHCKLFQGKVEVYQGKNEDGTKKLAYYDRIIAYVTGISLKDFDYNGEKIQAWKIGLRDENGDLAILSLGYSSGATRGFFNSLVAADLTKPISIGCYVKITDHGEFNLPSIAQGGKLVRWKYNDVPRTERTKVGSKDVINDEKATVWMLAVVKEIQEKLQSLPPVTAKQLAKDLDGVIVPDGTAELNDLPF